MILSLIFNIVCALRFRLTSIGQLEFQSVGFGNKQAKKSSILHLLAAKFEL